jgi:hypothetical protein
MSDRQMPVLIAGGSLVGLSTSLLLAAQEVPHLLVERHRGTAVHPRAASFHQRTMEIFRSVGLQGQIESASAQEFVQNGAIVSVESLASPEMKFFFRHFNEGVEALRRGCSSPRSGWSRCCAGRPRSAAPNTPTPPS